MASHSESGGERSTAAMAAHNTTTTENVRPTDQILSDSLIIVPFHIDSKPKDYEAAAATFDNDVEDAPVDLSEETTQVRTSFTGYINLTKTMIGSGMCYY